MTTSRFFQTFFACLAILGQTCQICYSQQANSINTPDFRVEKDSTAAVLRDVRLGKDGRLSLQIVSLTGELLGEQKVSVSYRDASIATAKSDSSGRVTISGLRPGVHMVTVSDSSQLYRFWTPQTAPPSAISHPAVVVGAEAALGQYGAPMMPMMAPGFLATTVTATALTAVLIGKNGSGSKVGVPASP